MAAGNVLLGQSIAELGQLAQDTGQSAYRGKQLYDGLLHGVRQIDQFNQVCCCILTLDEVFGSQQAPL